MFYSTCPTGNQNGALTFTLKAGSSKSISGKSNWLLFHPDLFRVKKVDQRHLNLIDIQHNGAYAECHYAECHYAAGHYAECHYAECRYYVQLLVV